MSIPIHAMFMIHLQIAYTRFWTLIHQNGLHRMLRRGLLHNAFDMTDGVQMGIL